MRTGKIIEGKIMGGWGFLLSTFCFLLLFGCATPTTPTSPDTIRYAVQARVAQDLRADTTHNPIGDSELYLDAAARLLSAAAGTDEDLAPDVLRNRILADPDLAINRTLAGEQTFRACYAHYQREHSADKARNQAMLRAIANGIHAGILTR